MQLALRVWLALIFLGLLGLTAVGESFDSQGVRLHYNDKGTGSPVILVHGFAENATQGWEETGVQHALLQAGYRVISLDARGHGQSAKPHSSMAYRTVIIDDLARLQDHLQITQSHLVGYSMGAAMVLKFIDLHPTRALSATLAGYGKPPLPAAWSPDFQQEITRNLKSMNLANGNDPAALAHLCVGWNHWDVSASRLRSLQTPVMVLSGDDDQFLPHATDLAQALPTTPLQTVPGDHGTARSQPKFSARVVTFLNSHDTPKVDPRTTPERPNIILIMADDLGYEGLGSYGGTSYQTPLLDRLAAQGMRFTHCYSQPVCTPSRVKIMTGQSNARNYREFGLLPAGEITFGNLLQEAGYRTCITGKWQLSGNPKSELKGSWWTECGFEQSCIWAYPHYLKEKDRRHYENTSLFGARKTSRFWNPGILQNGQYRPTSADDFGPDLYTDFILDFIESNQEAPFFVYYPMALTHSPFIPTPHSEGYKASDKTKSNPKYFGDMIRYTGHLVQRIIDKLEATGIAENTLVLFTTDNGTGRSIVSQLGDRLVPGGKAIPIDAGCHVPLIAYWKGRIEGGTLCHDLIDFSDFLPTLVEAGRASLPQDRPLDGRSFLPQLLGQTGNPRHEVIVHYDKDPSFAEPKFRRVRFAFDGHYKLYDDGRFYDIPRDWDEEHPLTTESITPSIAAIKERLTIAFESLPNWAPDNRAFAGEPDEVTRKRLNLRNRMLKRN